MSSENDNKPLILHLEPPCADVKVNDTMGKEEDYYRQRYNSLKLVVEDYKKQLTEYKNKCLGVDTMMQLYRESNQKCTNLIKHTKTLETALSVLQKRLTKNGLSNSVNTQDTELFVPGTSKQTLDNLAKETARLRTLLKQENGKKSADEVEELKVSLEEAKNENIEYRNKIKDMVSEHEATIEKITKEKQDEKAKLEKELNEVLAELKEKESINDAQQNTEQSATRLQVNSAGLITVQEMKYLLNLAVEKCSYLNKQVTLYTPDNSPNSESTTPENTLKMPTVSEEEYANVQAKYEEAVTMNRKWQDFSKERERQVKALTNQIQELSHSQGFDNMVENATKQKTYQLVNELKRRDQTVLTLNTTVHELTSELSKTRALVEVANNQSDNGLVELLKQQIRVCTEDFNTERKDREQAVQKASLLQQENETLKTEKTGLKLQIDQLKKSNELLQKQQPFFEPTSSSNYIESPLPQYKSQPLYSIPISMPQYSRQSSQAGSLRYPYIHAAPVQESPANAVELTSPRQQQAIPFTEYSGASGLTANVQDSVQRIQQPTNFDSMPRQTFDISGSYTPPLNNLSMPPLMRRGGEEELICPKCGNKYPNNELYHHIEACTS